MTTVNASREPTSPYALLQLTAHEAQVVDTLRKHSSVSRSDIARITNWSRPKVTAIVNRMIKSGFLIEVGEGDSQGGRRPHLLTLNSELGYVVGVDIGATSIDLALADLNAQVLLRSTGLADVRGGPTLLLSDVRRRILDMLRRRGLQPEQVLAVGVGVPGPVDFARATLVAPPLMPAWKNFPIRDFFHHLFPNALVSVDNDVNIMALGEVRVGAGVGVDNFLFVKVGTGIGAGVICDGLVHRGSTGSAGDIGHISADHNGPICHCGSAGCLEIMAAGPAIAARGVRATQTGASPILAKMMNANSGILRTEDVGAAARAGDRITIEIVQSSGQMIGNVLAGLVNFFNPSLILIGGGVSNIGNHFLASIRQAVLRRSTALATRELMISYSRMGSEAGVTGAIHLALDNLFLVRENERVLA
jgi:glucokinase-like ROK family protein